MATRMAATVVAVCALSLLVSSLVGLATGRSLSRDLDENRLLALQSSGADDVAAHMWSLSSAASALAASPQAKIALEGFTNAHRELLSDEASARRDDRRALAADYQQRYIEPLSAIRPDTELREIVPENPAGTYLQAQYSLGSGEASESATIDDADAIDDAGDGSTWSEVHAVVHPVYRDVVEQLGVSDLYLIEPDSGYIVYSVRKRSDLGTSLAAGPYSGSGLATAIDDVSRNPEGGTVMGDLTFYLPALDEPVGFVTSPVMDNDRLLGFLVIMYDGGPLNDLLSADGDWDGGGFPPTGETLLFADDGTVRTEPRSFVEDPATHLSTAAEAGLSDVDASIIEASGTTVLTQTVTDSTLDAAISGDRTVAERQNLLGVPALSAASAVPLPDLDWNVVAEVQVEAADAGFNDFSQLLFVGVAIIVVIVAFLAVAWAHRLVRPVRQIGEQLGGDSESSFAIDVSARSPVEFQELSSSFVAMTDRIAEQQDRIAETRRERLFLLRRMLPPAVAARIASGEPQPIDDVPSASVVVVVVLGLGDLVRSEASDASRDLVDRLLADLDDLAARQELDRTKVVGDAYFAACGHDRPFIDHAPRAVAFALDARDAIWAIGRQSPQPLDATVGVHSGSVMAGMTGGERAVYDVWGETVTTAHYLARHGDRGEIIVSDETRALLPESIELAPKAAGEDRQVWSVMVEPVRGAP